VNIQPGERVDFVFAVPADKRAHRVGDRRTLQMWWQSCSRPQPIYVHVPEHPLVQPERARIPGGDGTGPGADRIKVNTHRAEVGRPHNHLSKLSDFARASTCRNIAITLIVLRAGVGLFLFRQEAPETNRFGWSILRIMCLVRNLALPYCFVLWPEPHEGSRGPLASHSGGWSQANRLCRC
jgi:hypothetical protein